MTRAGPSGHAVLRVLARSTSWLWAGRWLWKGSLRWARSPCFPPGSADLSVSPEGDPLDPKVSSAVVGKVLTMPQQVPPDGLRLGRLCKGPDPKGGAPN